MKTGSFKALIAVKPKTLCEKDVFYHKKTGFLKFIIKFIFNEIKINILKTI
jgi:hypothetical protein